MFIPAFQSEHRASRAYASIGVETGIESASPHKLVMMLYEGFTDAVSQARGALAAGRIEAKGRAIGRAARIVEEGLRAGLNFESRGPIAGQLHDLYGYIGVRLTQANLHNDDEALQECQRLIEPLRSAWAAIEELT